ncbi:MAG: hypothetical protein R3E93_16610 [Thiothrix sp.]
MSGKLKLLIGGLLLGVLVTFALIGIKSTFTASQPEPTATATPTEQDWAKPSIMPNANMPSPDSFKDDSLFTRPLNDKPVEEDTSKVELVGEPDATDTDTPKQPDTDTAQPAETGLPAEEISDSPDVASTNDTPQTSKEDDSVQLVNEPEPDAPPPEKPATATTGKLEIIAQTESGKSVKANVYIQKTNGSNIDKATYTSKANFNLAPGTYKVTVRAEGYGSLSRNIKVPANAVVNEIFPLPKIAAAPPAAPAPAPVSQAPAPTRPAPPAAADGKLRIAALSADDGSPLTVNFTIARLDGSVVDRVSNVAMTELTLPAQEFVVSFEYKGFQGYKSLTVKPGQLITHTFNIRGVSGNPAPTMGQMQPTTPPLPVPAQQQPQSMEEMLIQRIQQELERQMR